MSADVRGEKNVLDKVRSGVAQSASMRHSGQADLRNVVRARLAERGETQSDLASALRVSDSIISTVLHGRRAAPKLVARICARLGIEAPANGVQKPRKPQRAEKPRRARKPAQKPPAPTPSAAAA